MENLKYTILAIICLFSKSVFSETEFNCVSDGLFEDENDCQMYHECIWINTPFERQEHLKCPDGLIYYPRRHRCVEIEELEIQFENGLKTAQELFEFIRFQNCINTKEKSESSNSKNLPTQDLEKFQLTDSDQILNTSQVNLNFNYNILEPNKTEYHNLTENEDNDGTKIISGYNRIFRNSFLLKKSKFPRRILDNDLLRNLFLIQILSVENNKTSTFSNETLSLNTTLKIGEIKDNITSTNSTKSFRKRKILSIDESINEFKNQSVIKSDDKFMNSSVIQNKSGTLNLTNLTEVSKLLKNFESLNLSNTTNQTNKLNFVQNKDKYFDNETLIESQTKFITNLSKITLKNLTNIIVIKNISSTISQTSKLPNTLTTTIIDMNSFNNLISNVTPKTVLTYKMNKTLKEEMGKFSSLKFENEKNILEPKNTEIPSFYRSTNPSENLIECIENDFGLECSCSTSISPPKCKQLINSFLSSCKVRGCKNNGKCIKIRNKNPIPYVCSCTSGYIGSFCEVERIDKVSNETFNENLLWEKKSSISNIDKLFPFLVKPQTEDQDFKEPLCEPNPCMNNAECLIERENFNCKCFNSSFSGKFCEIYIPAIEKLTTKRIIDVKRYNLLDDLIWQCPSNCLKNLGHGVCTLSSYGYPQCVCSKPWSGIDCSQRDLCTDNHCLNNSTCISYPEMNSYVCECPEGFTGRACEIRLLKKFIQKDITITRQPLTTPDNNLIFKNPCLNDKCHNNGTCMVAYSTESNKFRLFCRCMEGFHGEFCEKKDNPCEPNPCEPPNPVCIIQSDLNYKCTCNENCSLTKRLDKDVSDYFNPCNDSEICKKQPQGNNSFICTKSFLTQEYTICLLTRSINCLDSNPCLNGGVCMVDRINGWKCECNGGFMGKLCETEICAPVHRLFINHTMCLSDSSSLTNIGMNNQEIQLILDIHNSLRQEVSPSSSNMQKMYWDIRLQQYAQKRAQLCSVNNYGILMRQQPGYGIVIGENLAAGYDSWEHVLTSWISGRIDFNYKSNSSDDNQHSGHYTQLKFYFCKKMVYSQASRIGCGFAECLNTKYQTFFVCYYGEMFEPYQEGPKCSKCENNCDNGLCDCKGIFCLNGGSLDLETCSCTCPYSTFTGRFCENVICPKEDSPFCSKSLFEDKCWLYPVVRATCPHMCSICRKNDYEASANTNEYKFDQKEISNLSELIRILG